MARASIIITCYNLGAFLPEALESALAQTYDDFEVLLVDDGSTDPATIALLDRLPAHPRLRVLRSKNQGVARARNYGIREASGEYILPLDADDRIMPTYLARAVAVLDRHPEVGFVGCHYRTFGVREVEYRPAAYALPDLLVENVVPIASVFRRNCWEDVGGYCPEVKFEDWDLWLGIMERGYSARVIDDILFEYRVRPVSRHTGNQQPKVYEETLTLIRRRHATLYAQYIDDVIALKDRQFAALHSHTIWLEQQLDNWRQVAEEREEILASMGKPTESAMRRRLWWREQIARIERTTAGEPDLRSKIAAVLRGAGRVARRKLRLRL
jgi:glycosyltransferase involved in cell wall biosynthesis